MLALENSIAEERRMLRLTINGKSHDVDVEPDVPLLWVIRECAGRPARSRGCESLTMKV
jgi:aerobic-type carbon monoxide dehydrogenase small subunit (CoxS/CutS family)